MAERFFRLFPSQRKHLFAFLSRPRCRLTGAENLSLSPPFSAFAHFPAPGSFSPSLHLTHRARERRERRAATCICANLHPTFATPVFPLSAKWSLYHCLEGEAESPFSEPLSKGNIVEKGSRALRAYGCDLTCLGFLLHPLRGTKVSSAEQVEVLIENRY